MAGSAGACGPRAHRNSGASRRRRHAHTGRRSLRRRSMSLGMRGFCTFALLIGLAVDGTAQVRDNAAAATGSASIAGTIVTDAEPPRPVRRALVSITTVDRVVDKTIVTDDNGRFVVGGLPA